MINLDLDWISTRATQSYPLADDVSGISIQNTPIPDSLLLDLRIYAPSIYDIDYNKFYLKQIKDQRYTLSFVIGYQDKECLIAEGIPKTIGLTNSVQDRYFILAPIKNQNIEWFQKLTGGICIGNTIQYTYGTLFFSFQTAKLNRSCVSIIDFQISECIQNIQVGNEKLTGQVILQAGEGINIDVVDNTISISLDHQYLSQLLQSAITDLYGIPVKTINGVLPDQNGNISITGVDCVSINPLSKGTISISNPCSKPCCDSSDTEAIESALQIVKQKQATIIQYYVNMANNINYMQSNLSTLMST